MLKEEHRSRSGFLSICSAFNLFPTVVVFLALAPAFQYVLNFRVAEPSCRPRAAGLRLRRRLCSTSSDAQMRQFRKTTGEQGARQQRMGVRKYSRHPNYLGEILMWWGICLISLSAPGASPVCTPSARFVNTLMFAFISVPMMERRQLEPKAGVRRLQSGDRRASAEACGFLRKRDRRVTQKITLNGNPEERPSVVRIQMQSPAQGGGIRLRLF